MIHKGPNEELASSYNVILKWIAENSYEISSPGRESHLKCPWNEPNPGEWVTEIQLPVHEKGM